jgi:hypothetical protein
MYHLELTPKSYELKITESLTVQGIKKLDCNINIKRYPTLWLMTNENYLGSVFDFQLELGTLVSPVGGVLGLAGEGGVVVLLLRGQLQDRPRVEPPTVGEGLDHVVDPVPQHVTEPVYPGDLRK